MNVLLVNIESNVKLSSVCQLSKLLGFVADVVDL